MIREFQTEDTEQVMKLWLSGNEDAHPFVPEGYWRSHFREVQKALLQSKVFVYVTDEKILGFLGMTDNYIAGIFVAKSCRSCGIGRQLLTHAKQKYDTLSLNVYQKNSRAAAFYGREGFSILSEGMDKAAGEKEYTMVWKNPAQFPINRNWPDFLFKNICSFTGAAPDPGFPGPPLFQNWVPMYPGRFFWLQTSCPDPGFRSWDTPKPACRTRPPQS